jgi:nitrogen fixation protein NifU and related proteins
VRVEPFAAGQPGDEVGVALQEVEAGQGLGRFPADLLEGRGARLALKIDHPEEDEQNGRAVRVAVLVADHFRTHVGLDGKLFFELPLEGLAGAFAGLDLAAGKLPFEGVAVTGAALADQDPALALNNAGDDDDSPQGPLHNRHKGLLEHIRGREGCQIMHSEKLLDHFRNPRNAGELEPPAIVVEASNPACGDTIRLSVRVEQGRIAEARFQVRGCTASIAAGSALTEWLTGRPLEGLAGLRAADIEEALGGLAPESRHAAALAVDAVRALEKVVSGR